MGKLKRDMILGKFDGDSEYYFGGYLIRGTPFAVHKRIRMQRSISLAGGKIKQVWKPEYEKGWQITHVPTGMSVNSKIDPLIWPTRKAAIDFCAKLTHPDWHKPYKRFPRHLRLELIAARNEYQSHQR